MKIGIIGSGKFGQALEKVFSLKHNVQMYDTEAQDLGVNFVPKLIIIAIPSTAKINNTNANLFYIKKFFKSKIIR